MRNVHPLGTQENARRDGAASPGGVRAGAEVGVSASGIDVLEAPSSRRADGGSAAKVAGKAVKRKATMTDAEIAKWIIDRCHTDGDCLIWDGAVALNAGPAVTSPYTGKTAPARRVLMQALGIDIKGKMCSTTCGHPLCMEKGHLAAITRRQLQQKTGAKNSINVLRSAKLAEAARKRSYITMDLVREMRASGMSAKQAADHHQIPLQTAARILRHDSWREYGSNPFHGLGAR